jgi:membrane protease YdiL (CAAX protease family)
MHTFLSLFWNFRQRRLRAGWRLILHTILMLVCLLIAAIPMVVLVLLLPIETDGIVVDGGGGIVQSLGILGSVLIGAWALDRRRWRSLGWRKSGWYRDLAIGLALGAVAMLGIFAIEIIFGWARMSRVGATATISWGQIVGHQVIWLLVMIAVGFGEEALSRGYHLKNLAEGARGLGVTGAVIVATLGSSLVFGLLHAGNDNASLISTASIVLAGVMLAAARIATGSLAAPIGLHITWNYFQGPLLGFPVSGQATAGSLLQLEQMGNPLWTGGDFGPEAGLLGIFVELGLILFFVLWGGRQGWRSASLRLCRFRPIDQTRRSPRGEMRTGVSLPSVR